MLNSHDPGYAETKRIKLGTSSMPEEYTSLADWIAHTYSVTRPLNIYFDRISDGELPRLNIIFEHAADSETFDLKAGYGFNSRKQKRVREAAIEHGALSDLSAEDQAKTLLIFSEFERGAREEAAAAINQSDINKLRLALSGPPVWQVSLIFGVAIVFFETEKDKASAEGKRAQEVWRKALQAKALEYDSCGYFQKTPMQVSFDTKENFDTKYNGNWRAYYN